MFYIIIAILVIYLSQININGEYFRRTYTFIFSSYVIIAFLILNGYFSDDVRHFLRVIFDYFEWHLDYADDRMTERNFKNSDLVYYIGYAYLVPIFFINLVSVGEEYANAQKKSFKKQVFGMVYFLMFIFFGYMLFDSLSSSDPVAMERTDGMISIRFFTNQLGIVFMPVGLMAITFVCTVYTKSCITTISRTLGEIFFKLKKGINK